MKREMAPEEKLQVNAATGRAKGRLKTFENKSDVIADLAKQTAAIGENTICLSEGIAILRSSKNNDDAIASLAEHIAVLDVYAKRLADELEILKSVNQ